ncbi:hypothetical protein D1AOALGA4SA_9434 [Olavius algarvensis Delta 1 endosymbiont]|nr:hypothetical protein D1AOALGA4SA_9434 [Olavius algarvensis Delta 1 endosymbiont]
MGFFRRHIIRYRSKNFELWSFLSATSRWPGQSLIPLP